MTHPIDVDSLLQPVSEDRPAGEDLDGSADLIAFAEACERKPERRMGDSVIPAEEPEWPTVLEDGVALLSRSKDVSVAVQVTRALLAEAGFDGLRDGLTLLNGLVERFWDSCYPTLDDPDDAPAQLRIFQLQELAAPATISLLLGAPWVQSREHDIRLRDALVACRKRAPAEGQEALAQDAVRSAFGDLPIARRDEFAAAVRDCHDLVESLVAGLQERSAPTDPSFRPDMLTGLVESAREMIDEIAPKSLPVTDSADPEVDSDPQTAGTVDSRAAAPPTGFSSRDQVEGALDMMCEYLERAEPNSPVPLVLRGAKAMLHMTFLELSSKVEIFQGMSQLLEASSSDGGWE